jgi:excisionase family DNA binding protein
MSVQLLISKAEAAALLGISASGFERHVMRELTRIRIGHSIKFKRTEVLDWIERQAAGGALARMVQSALEEDATAPPAAALPPIPSEPRPRGQGRTAQMFRTFRGKT